MTAARKAAAQPGLFEVVPDDPRIDRPRARVTDPGTSSAAAQLVRPSLGRIQVLVLETFRSRGAMTARTAERLPEFSAYGFSTIRKRISELARAGALEAVGVDRSGRAPATIYQARGVNLEPGGTR